MKLNLSKAIDPASRRGYAGTSRKTLLGVVRRAVEAAGGKRVSQHEFLGLSGMSYKEVLRHFTRWGEVLRAAGFNFRPHNSMIDAGLLLVDWAKVVRDLRRLPRRSEYKARGKYSYKTLESRFDGWVNVPDAFLVFAGEKPEWADLKALIPVLQKAQTPPLVRRPRRRRGAKDKCPIVYGAPLDACALRHAPMNENGVIFLFGTMAQRLGFTVDSVRPGFPDCEAKRRVEAEAWRRVRIEFEYESRNFRQHGHDAAGCDLIVCWTHNWPECPLEVIALKEEMARLNATNGK